MRFAMFAVLLSACGCSGQDPLERELFDAVGKFRTAMVAHYQDHKGASLAVAPTLVDCDLKRVVPKSLSSVGGEREGFCHAKVRWAVRFGNEPTVFDALLYVHEGKWRLASYWIVTRRSNGQEDAIGPFSTDALMKNVKGEPFLQPLLDLLKADVATFEAWEAEKQAKEDVRK